MAHASRGAVSCAAVDIQTTADRSSRGDTAIAPLPPHTSDAMSPHATLSTVIHIADPATSHEEAQARAARAGCDEAVLLRRRGTALAWVAERRRPTQPSAELVRAEWLASRPVMLAGYVSGEVAAATAQIRDSLALTEAVLEGESAADLFERAPYAARLASRFEMLAATEDEGDPQEIETIEFDAMEAGEPVAENLWVKLSWLSFEDDDASLRFRFSFGLVGYEDVAADTRRQQAAAELTEALFPESAVISANTRLHALLAQALATERLAYVERIVYFNAPDGGAQFHQDVERGHLGVVFAQAHGRTGWLTLPKEELMDEIQGLLADADQTDALAALPPRARMCKELAAFGVDRARLSQALDDGDHDGLEILLNRCPAFARRLIERGHCYLLRPGDLILLPQHDAVRCAWHAVFCLDDFIGEALSFAVRAV